MAVKAMYGNFVRHIVGFVGVVWFLIMICMTIVIYKWGSDGVSFIAEDELSKSLEELDRLKMQNVELNKLAADLRSMKEKYIHQRSQSNSSLQEEDFVEQADQTTRSTKTAMQSQLKFPYNEFWSPSVKYEITRRKTESDVIEMWNFVRTKLQSVRQACESRNAKLAISHVESILNLGVDVHRTVLTDLHTLTALSNSENWRQRESNELSRLVQSRLRSLQNPKASCDDTKLLVCSMNKGCGFGCQLHHVAYCLTVAYGTGRTMVLDAGSWRYSPDGWEKFFMPVSKCRLGKRDVSVMWSTGTHVNRIVTMPIIDSINPRPPFLPQAIPSSIADRLIRLHGHPYVWWLGQLLLYITRPQPSLTADMKEVSRKLGFKRPIVGVHVRRTDKVGVEAAYHSLDEYMVYVEQYFDLLEMKKPGVRRRIYLASDDARVLQEAREKYKNYEVICDDEFSRTAAMSSRYTEASLRAIILDIHFLSQTDYLVCTFSSQVCRLAYELMQTRFPDASRYFRSLDDIFYFGGQNPYNQIAIAPHVAQSENEIDLEVGDYIGIAGNHWNGYSKGTNRRTGAVGLYPSYKAVDVITTEDFEFDEQFAKQKTQL